MPDERDAPAEGLLRLFRAAPFRLTLLSLALFAFAGAAFMAYVYIAATGEARRRTDAEILREADNLVEVYDRAGASALNTVLVSRMAGERRFLYLLLAPDNRKISGSLARSPVEGFGGEPTWIRFSLSGFDEDGRPRSIPARGYQQRLPNGEILFVGADTGDDQSFIVTLARGLWGAGALVVVLGITAGLLVSRNFTRAMTGLTNVVAAARNGDLTARAAVRGAGDELDQLAEGLNDMLDRLDRSMSAHRHAGDSIAHDLRSPLTRLKARLESALLDMEAGRGDSRQALRQALDDTDGVLRTFSAVLAISRLQAAGEAPNAVIFDPAGLVGDMTELYGPLCEDKGLEIACDIAAGLTVRGNPAFLAQALANLVDNAVKYTPAGGAVMVRLRRRASGDTEISVTDTGPGVPHPDRYRVVDRFVRLENSRNLPGAGLGLSLVAAVAQAHGGRLELGEGPGAYDGSGPGLRAALILPEVA
ncbi:MAG: HAMP domain-containing histidine kinase [Phenylobacterium sp.]|uniref:sensor histidine kinase n=1 Tax=Phenylobacterium sp. TaxID=1871053 RepID=UPI0025EC8488|nr:HAMP domain-containing sensor histidine kinase [Phenylobacterium sp.]MCA6297894.1 HAMP domain-containing histidine kinase [Phenylobacterium sp.]